MKQKDLFKEFQFKNLVEFQSKDSKWKVIHFTDSPTSRLEKWDGDTKEFEILVSKDELKDLFSINIS